MYPHCSKAQNTVSQLHDRLTVHILLTTVAYIDIASLE
jgi:hypothetical protein